MLVGVPAIVLQGLRHAWLHGLQCGRARAGGTAAGVERHWVGGVWTAALGEELHLGLGLEGVGLQGLVVRVEHKWHEDEHRICGLQGMGYTELGLGALQGLQRDGRDFGWGQEGGAGARVLCKRVCKSVA